MGEGTAGRDIQHAVLSEKKLLSVLFAYWEALLQGRKTIIHTSILRPMLGSLSSLTQPDPPAVRKERMDAILHLLVNIKEVGNLIKMMKEYCYAR